MEVSLKDFCFKTANFLEKEAEKIKFKKRSSTDPDFLTKNTFTAASQAMHSLGYVLKDERCPQHDLVIHLGNVFGFKIKE